ncbi:MAG: type II CAAX prenyl endopeptidase Rce1 family protein [Eubacteriales bacterium]
MKCPHCGKEIEDDSKFCKYCTKRIESDTGGLNSTDNPENSIPPHYPIDMNPPEFQKSNSVRKGTSKLRALVSVILYISLLFIFQSCVTSGYTTSLMLDSPIPGTTSDEAALDYMQNLVDRVNEKTTIILLIANLLVLLSVCLIFQLRRKNPRVEMSVFRVNPFRFASFAVFGMALNVFVSCTLSFIPLPDEILSSFESTYSTLYSGGGINSLIVEIFSVAVVAGIVEEIIFRGIALRRLIPAFGNFWSVVITALLFGLAHGTPIAIGYAFLIGLLFGTIFVCYKSIVPCIVCHIFFNLTSYLLSAAPEYSIFFIYVISIALIILLTYRIFIRRPTFYDIFYDTDSLIPPINEREREIVSKLREMQKTGDADPDELVTLADDWEENRKSTGKSSKKH